jgi:hypothetical protein
MLSHTWPDVPEVALSKQITFLTFYLLLYIYIYKLRGLSPRANYTDRATAACRRS